jgi:hypothetical protein
VSFNPDVHKSRGLIPEKRDTGHLAREGATRRCRRWNPLLELNDEMMFMVLCYEDPLTSAIGYDAETVSLVAPMADFMTEEEWRKWEKQHAEAVIKMGERYAPNMTWDICN